MSDAPARFVVTVAGAPGADHQELIELAGGLREELIEAGADSAETLRGGEAPAGSKGDPVTLAGVLVALAPAALTGFVTMLQSWLTRHDRTTLTLERGGEKITVTGSLSNDQQQMIAAWFQAGKPQ